MFSCTVSNATKAIERIRANPEYNNFKISYGKDRCANPPKLQYVFRCIQDHYRRSDHYISILVATSVLFLDPREPRGLLHLKVVNRVTRLAKGAPSPRLLWKTLRSSPLLPEGGLRTFTQPHVTTLPFPLFLGILIDGRSDPVVPLRSNDRRKQAVTLPRFRGYPGSQFTTPCKYAHRRE
jgi:hypothetical protein